MLPSVTLPPFKTTAPKSLESTVQDGVKSKMLKGGFHVLLIDGRNGHAALLQRAADVTVS